MPTAHPGKPSYIDKNYPVAPSTPGVATPGKPSYRDSSLENIEFVPEPATIEEYQASVDEYESGSYCDVHVPFAPNTSAVNTHLASIVKHDAEVAKQEGAEYTTAWQNFMNWAGGLDYPLKVQDVPRKDPYNPEDVGVAPAANNAKTAADEEKKQKGDKSYLWDEFLRGVDKGYNEEPEDTNVFVESMEKAWDAITGVVDPGNYYLLIIGGGVLLLILLIK